MSKMLLYCTLLKIIFIQIDFFSNNSKAAYPHRFSGSEIAWLTITDWLAGRQPITDCQRQKNAADNELNA